MSDGVLLALACPYATVGCVWGLYAVMVRFELELGARWTLPFVYVYAAAFWPFDVVAAVRRRKATRRALAGKRDPATGYFVDDSTY